jgi:hypothetical protein
MMKDDTTKKSEKSRRAGRDSLPECAAHSSAKTRQQKKGKTGNASVG